MSSGPMTALAAAALLAWATAAHAQALPYLKGQQQCASDYTESGSYMRATGTRRRAQR